MTFQAVYQESFTFYDLRKFEKSPTPFEHRNFAAFEDQIYNRKMHHKSTRKRKKYFWKVVKKKWGRG